MLNHKFFFQPGSWKGEGTITLTLSDDELKYHTEWQVQPERNGVICCTQHVQIDGGGEKVINELSFSEVTADKFAVKLDNAMIGTVFGKGLIDDKVIAWEYRDGKVGFEGFEVYERNDDGSYAMRGEYASDDQTRTQIKGEIWNTEDR